MSFSGGKDSTATLLLAIERGAPNITAAFADTGNEHSETLEYIRYIERELGVPVTWLKADFAERIANKRMFIARDVRTGRKKGKRLRWTNKAKRRALAVLHPTGNPYLDLCLWKGRFPSRKAQFCTEELKTALLVDYQIGIIDAGNTVESWQGIRADESLNRRDALEREDRGGGLTIYRPILRWTAQETVDYVRSKGVKLNPLYSQGMNRVGCMPCINVSKPELLEISKRFQEHLKRIEEWERLVALASKRGYTTFFTDSKLDGESDREAMARLSVWSRIEWAQTSRGGKQFNFFASEPAKACASSYGLCE